MSNGIRKHPATTHGGAHTLEYGVWLSMKRRCDSPNVKTYHRYGGRGIKVCERWQGKDGFPNFLADMGRKPEGKSINRIDNDGNYEPSNCEWATRKEQANNMSNNRIIEYGFCRRTLSKWAITRKIPVTTLHQRFVYGWSIHKALFKPLRSSGRAGRENKEGRGRI